jgi:hypothetical protein
MVFARFEPERRAPDAPCVHESPLRIPIRVFVPLWSSGYTVSVPVPVSLPGITRATADDVSTNLTLCGKLNTG